MNENLLKKGIAQLGGTITDRQIEQFSIYSAMLKEWNEKMNLTAITDDDGIAVKHFLDSILPIYKLEIPQGARVADVGTGAGFPGIPLKIMRPDIHITLIDSLNKRVTFLTEVCTRLEIDNTKCIHGRAEELGKAPEYREKFDVVTSRAVARLKILGEYCLPFVSVGGIFLALKAEDVADEFLEAKPMLGSLGGGDVEVIDAPLPESDMLRRLVTVKKARITPPQFPRRANKIKK